MKDALKSHPNRSSKHSNLLKVFIWEKKWRSFVENAAWVSMKRHLGENIVVVRFVTLVSENGFCKKLNPFCVLIFCLHFFLRISSKILKKISTYLSGSHMCWTQKLIKTLLRFPPIEKVHDPILPLLLGQILSLLII